MVNGQSIIPVRYGQIKAGFNVNPNKRITDLEVLLKAAKDRLKAAKRGYGLVSHCIYRSADETFNGKPVDRYKFLFPVGGVPVMVYSLTSAMNSNVKNWSFTGSKESKIVFDAFVKYFGDRISKKGQTFTFAQESENIHELSLADTVKRGYEALGSPEGLVFLTSADIPLFSNVDGVISAAGDISRVAASFDLNVKDNTKWPLERNSYHTVRGYNGQTLDFKEPNLEMVRLSETGFFFYDVFYGSRKNGGFGIETILEMATMMTESGYKDRTAELTKNILRHSGNVLGIALDRVLKRKLKIDYSTMYDLAKSVFGGPVDIRFDHTEPQRLVDVDSFEDWLLYNHVMGFAMEQYGMKDAGIKTIFPYACDMVEFRDNVMPEISGQIPLLSEFPEYISSIFKQFDLGEPYLPEIAGSQLPIKDKEAMKDIEMAYRAFAQATPDL